MVLAFLSLTTGTAIAGEAGLIGKSGFAGRNVGYLVADLTTGEVLREANTESAFIPASLIKLATGYAALEILGPNHRFATSVYAEPLGRGLRLHLSGGGDPVLVQEDLAVLSERLAANIGAIRIEQFSYDEDAVPFATAVDPGDDVANSYNPPVSALSVNFNRQWLKWQRPAEHFAMIAGLVPDLGQAVAGVAAQAPPDGRPVQILPSDEFGRTVYLIGPRQPSKGQRRVAVRKPALRTALMLRDFAAKAGLALPLPVAGARPAGSQPVATVLSRPMDEIAGALFKYSNNLSAELTGMAAAARLLERPVPIRESAAAIKNWLSGPGKISMKATTHWLNLSGLSGASLMSPRELIALLQKASLRPYNGRPFLELLSTPRWAKRQPELALRAKSGTMSYSRGLAGVMRSAGGRQVLFVLMHTDFAARERFEKHPQRFSNAVRRRAGRWLGRARALERQLLLHWHETL